MSEDNNDLTGDTSAIKAISEDRDYIETVVNTDVGQEYVQQMQAHLDRSNAMANRTESETEVLKWRIRMFTDEFLYMRPPQGSKMTGKLREMMVGDSKSPLSDKEMQEIRRLQDVAINLATLGREGALHEFLSKVTKVQRKEDGESDESTGASNDLRSLFK